MKYSIIIPTYNRADELCHTLRSLAGLSPDGDWQVIVVDNNSKDNTRAVVQEAEDWFPVPLEYIFEPIQGRCAALNTGIRASTGDIIVTTDDDVRVKSDWLNQAATALNEYHCDYVGGKVMPIWGGERPNWLPNHGGRHWGVIALLDYGSEALEYDEHHVPLGVNLAFRRDAFARAGLWDNRVGRKAGTLLGQEVREWGLRAKAAGLRGFYTPRMIVHHVISEDRLNKSYFRRWFYWNGISRALLYNQARINMEAPEETTLDYTQVPHIAGVPRYMFRTYLHTFFDMARAYLHGDEEAGFERELELCFFAGVVKQRWRDRKKQPETSSAKANLLQAQGISYEVGRVNE
jgi:glycosyltransferase involved in cell wall biosynthesis